VISDKPLSGIISTIMPFGLESYVRGESSRLNSDDVIVHSSQDQTFLSRSKVKQGYDLIDKYKVLIGQLISGHIGETDEKGQVKVLATVKEIGPGEVCTASYICAGGFETSVEAKNLRTYLSTKFVRFLLLQTLSSMHITKGSFSFVPLQDFTNEWNDSILYKKYNLSTAEINYIESMIKPME
jgi:site-specific DNA-methyltransferase (adenine-specific)